MNIPATAQTPTATTQQCRVRRKRAQGCTIPLRPRETHAWAKRRHGGGRDDGGVDGDGSSVHRAGTSWWRIRCGDVGTDPFGLGPLSCLRRQ